jgi:hypothetical protein
MTEEEASAAYSLRKTQIKAFLDQKSKTSSPSLLKPTISAKPQTVTKKILTRFTPDLNKISKHTIDFSLNSQFNLKQRLKSCEPTPNTHAAPYDTTQSLYTRTVNWKKQITDNHNQLKLLKTLKSLEGCTFEPHINLFPVKNLTAEIYQRNLNWKKTLFQKNEKMKELKILKELEKCSFEPKLISKNPMFTLNFQQRNKKWEERVYIKLKKIQQTNSKNLVFTPKVHKKRPASKPNPRFTNLLLKLDEISDKIDRQLSKSVML